MEEADLLVLGAEPYEEDEHISLKEVVLKTHNPWTGLRIRDLDISRQAIIVMVERRHKMLIPKGDLVLLEQRPEDGLLSGLPDFPMLDGHRSEAELASVISSPGSGLQIRERKSYRHIFSHREWEMQVMEILCSSRHEFDAAAEILFPRIRTMTAEVSEILNRYSIPTAFRPCVQYLQK